LRVRWLSVCINSVIASNAATGGAANPSSSGHALWHVVTTCDDDGPGGLRSALSEALSGDLILLDQLTCSKITLTNGPLEIPQQDIDIGAAPGTTDVENDLRVV